MIVSSSHGSYVANPRQSYVLGYVTRLDFPGISTTIPSLKKKLISGTVTVLLLLKSYQVSRSSPGRAAAIGYADIA
ncbi:hypothetical protein ACOSQ2_008299 [Xanthoceras sorbifolium]